MTPALTPALTASRSPRLLVVQHEEGTGPGWFRPWLEEAGLLLDVVHPYAGGELPAPGGPDAGDRPGYAGLLVLGGAMGPADDERFPWLPATRGLMAHAVEIGLPTFGICLGAELLALAGGGEVRRGPRPELGVVDLDLAPAAADDPVLRALTGTPDGQVRVVQWHWEEIARLPPSAQWLAGSSAYVNQAFRFGTAAWAVQGHPEVTGDIAASWARQDSPLLVAEGRTPASLLAEVRAAEGDLTRTWRPVAEAFAGVVHAFHASGAVAAR